MNRQQENAALNNPQQNLNTIQRPIQALTTASTSTQAVKAPPSTDDKETAKKSSEEIKRKVIQRFLVVCQYCGFCGYDHAKCERCNRVFTENPKLMPCPATAAANAAAASAAAAVQVKTGGEKKIALMGELLNRSQTKSLAALSVTPTRGGRGDPPVRRQTRSGRTRPAESEPDILTHDGTCITFSEYKKRNPSVHKVVHMPRSQQTANPSTVAQKLQLSTAGQSPMTALSNVARVAIQPKPSGTTNPQATEQTMTLSSVQRTSHNNYEIQTQHFIQNRSIQQFQNYSEKDRNSAKMLVILASGEQRSITFTLPRESCTVQDLLEQVGVPFDDKTTIQCVESPGANIDFVVTVGFSVQESASELISKTEESIQMNRQQENAALNNPQQNLNTIQRPIQALTTASTSTQAVKAPPSTDDKETAKKSSEEIKRKVIQRFLVVCQYCGFCGYDHAKCERCNRVFTENPKLMPCPATAAANAAAASAAAAVQVKTGGEKKIALMGELLNRSQTKSLAALSVTPTRGGRGDPPVRRQTRSGRTRPAESEPDILTHDGTCITFSEYKKRNPSVHKVVHMTQKLQFLTAGQSPMTDLSNVARVAIQAKPSGTTNPQTTEQTMTLSSVQRTSHNNYEIQTQHVIQNRSIQQFQNYSEKDRNSAKMLVILASGERRLLTFTLPRESCTVQDLLEQVGVPFDDQTTIQCVDSPGANIYFVVTVGFSVQESASELISKTEESIQMNRQQENAKNAQHVIQNRRIQQFQNYSEKDRKSAKMLVILASGEQRLLTFTLPKESCTVQDLLEQVGVPFDDKTTIQCVGSPGANIYFVVTVGFSVQESASELISKTEESIQINRQQENAALNNPQQNLNTIQCPIQALTTASTSTQAVKAPPSTDDKETAKKSSEEIKRKVIQRFLVVCQYCGFCGYDHAKCERCNRVFTENPKRMPCPATAAANAAAASAAAAVQVKTGGEKKIALMGELLNRSQTKSLAALSVTPTRGGRGDPPVRRQTRSGRTRPAESEPDILTHDGTCMTFSEYKKRNPSVHKVVHMTQKLQFLTAGQSPMTDLSNVARVAIQAKPSGTTNPQTTEQTMTLSSVQRTSHNNYEIQTQHVIQNRSIQQFQNYSEKDRNSAKMLVILASGERRLLTFTLPRESCTVQDLLEQVGVPFDDQTTIQCVDSPGANIYFVVTVGFSVQESASELISKTEESIQMNRQQENAKNAQHVIQNRRIQQFQNYSEKDRKSAKMLVILASGEQRLLTFTLPKESCTVQDLLEQVGVPFDDKTTIQCVGSPGANIYFVVTVGFSVQESASELISKTEESIQINRQQENAALNNPQQNLNTIQCPIQALTTASTSTQAVKAPPSTDDKETAKKSSEEIKRKVIQRFLVVCQYCGFCGYDHAKCERCNRVFTENPKRMPCPATAAANAAAASAAAAVQVKTVGEKKRALAGEQLNRSQTKSLAALSVTPTRGGTC